MATTTEDRQFPRIGFYEGVNVSIVATNGSSQRACKMIDVSLKGCKLLVPENDSVPEKQFFLVLSEQDSVYRRCKRVWVKGNEIGVRFLADATLVKETRPDNVRKAEG